MEPAVIFGTRANGLLVLDVKRAGTASVDQALFELTSDGLSAAIWAYEHPDFSALLGFLDAMERDWRGWTGRRDWASLEGEVAITAEHTGSHIELSVALRRSMSWRARAEMMVGPGEDITNAATAAKLLFA